MASLVKHIGSFSTKTAAATIVWAPGVSTAAGNLIVAYFVFDNSATASKPVVSSIDKPGGESATWVFLGAARTTSTAGAGTFAQGELWAIKTTVDWITPTITATLDASVTMRSMGFSEFIRADVTMVSTTGATYSTTTTAASAVTTGTAPATDDLALGLIFQSNSASVPAGSAAANSWSTPQIVGSTGGTAATNNMGEFQYKVLTASGHQTLVNRAGLTAGNGAIIAIVKGTPEPPKPKAETFTDDFSTEDTAKWPVGTRTGTIAFSGGQVAITDLSADYSRLQSQANAYDLTDSYVYVKMTTPSPMVVGEEATLGAYATAAPASMNGPVFLVFNDGAPKMSSRLVTNNANNDSFLAYDPVAMAYGRIRRDATNIYWDTSPDAVTWTTRRTLASAMDLRSVTIELSQGQWQASTPLRTSYFDNLNTLGSTAQSYPLAGTLTATSTTAGDLAAVHPLAGVLTATSAAAGNVTAVHPLAGTAPANSTTTGNPVAVHPVSGTVAGTTTTTGTIGTVVGAQAYPLAGATSATSATSGTLLRLNLAVDGTTAGISTTVGSPAAVHPLAGAALPAVTTSTGTIGAALPLTGIAAATTSTTGNPAAVHPMGGLVAGAGDTVGNATAVYRLTGAAAATSATSGTINLALGAQDYPLAGVLAAVTTTAGTIGTVVGAQAYPLTGVSSATTTTAGDITVTTPGGGLPVVTGLAGWWDASDTASIIQTGNAVSQWNDKSPNGRHVAQATGSRQPTTNTNTINGQNVVRFDGLQQFLFRPSPVQMVNAATGEWSAFAVVRTSTISGTRDVLDQDSGSGNRIVQFLRHNNAVVQTVAFNTGGIAQVDANSNLAVADTPFCYSAVRTATTVEVWVNGSTDGPLATSGTANNASNYALALGGSRGATAAGFQWWQGDIAEVITYNRALTGTERQQVESYLTGKWMVAPPAGTDYPLAGTVAAVTTTAGTISTVAGARDYPLAGVITAGSTTAGAVRANLSADGTAAATTTTAGNPAAIHPLAGTLPATSSAAGDPALRTPLAGTVAGISTTAGTFAPESMSGTVAATAGSSGTLRGQYAAAGTVTAATATTGAVRGVYRLAGATDATTATAGTLRGRYPIAGVTAAITATYGRITPRGFFIPRPNDGQTPRPDTGTTGRPDAGRTGRPDTGTTARADAGTTTRPRELEHA